MGKFLLAAFRFLFAQRFQQNSQIAPHHILISGDGSIAGNQRIQAVYRRARFLAYRLQRRILILRLGKQRRAACCLHSVRYRFKQPWRKRLVRLQRYHGDHFQPVSVGKVGESFMERDDLFAGESGEGRCQFLIQIGQ